ncbi:winged helix-turn-helix transcriptional regulator [Pseudorhizobium flavum]|uniref:winged helix-turn-helix transcriptional regulator n=1 Tax=Pseudorhizobium flavum TaxID=1335061 RepID=UPI00098505AB
MPGTRCPRQWPSQPGWRRGIRSGARRDNPTVSHRMLALELRKLEKAGIVRRTSYAGYPLRVEYDLTPAGRQLVPLVDAIGDWWEDLHPLSGEVAEARSVA